MRPTTPPLHGHLAQLSLACLGLGAGCQDPPELRYETEHLRIGTGFDEPLCQGDLDHYELVIATAEAELATQLDKRVKLYVWGPSWEQVNERWCGQGYEAGCSAGRVIYSSQWALDHELVHVVADTLGNPAPFWAEGVAEAIQTNRTIFGGSAPVDNLELSSPELSYLTAGHFSRWLIETHGADSYRALLAASGGARAAFERTYDMSFEQAQAAYFEQAPFSYGALIACEHAELEQLDAMTWSEAVEIDCASSDTFGGPGGMGTWRVVSITARGFYELSTDADYGLIGRCRDESLALQPREDDPALGDLPPTTPAHQQQYTRSFFADEPVVLELSPGRYEVLVGFGDHEMRSTQLTVRAAPGPIPQVPEMGP